MQRSAEFSKCGVYRYALHRIWDLSLPSLLFIGLNPSKADDISDDPTLRRCIRFAKSWGYGRFSIVNLFAFCSHDPTVLFQANDPIGPKNDRVLKKNISNASTIVLIWGNHGTFLKRNEKILKLIKKPLCLKVNKNGAPAHPLYLKATLKPRPYFYDNENPHK